MQPGATGETLWNFERFKKIIMVIIEIKKDNVKL